MIVLLGKVFSFFFVLGILVLIHELGHFLTAKRLGVRVEVFSFGFGKRIAGWEKGGTDYRISLIPLGGYVKMAGEEAEDVKGAPDEFQNQKRWKRALILVNGGFFNILLALGLLSILYVQGVEKPKYLEEPSVVGWVQPDSPAFKAGLLAGDRILQINKRIISRWDELETLITTSPREELKMVVLRDGQRKSLSIHPRTVTSYEIGDIGILYPLPPILGTIASGMAASKAGLQEGDRITAIEGKPIKTFFELRDLVAANPNKTLLFTVSRGGSSLPVRVTPSSSSGKGVLGVFPLMETTVKKYPLFQAIGNGVKECFGLVKLTFSVIRKLFVGKLSVKTLSGPIDIADFSYAAVKSGSSSFLRFLAFISLQLGIINLLPLPALDGGHLFVLIIEGILRRDLSLQWKERIAQAGFFLLMALSVFVILNDVLKRFPLGK